MELPRTVGCGRDPGRKPLYGLEFIKYWVIFGEMHKISRRL